MRFWPADLCLALAFAAVLSALAYVSVFEPRSQEFIQEKR